MRTGAGKVNRSSGGSQKLKRQSLNSNAQRSAGKSPWDPLAEHALLDRVGQRFLSGAIAKVRDS